MRLTAYLRFDYMNWKAKFACLYRCVIRTAITYNNNLKLRALSSAGNGVQRSAYDRPFVARWNNDRNHETTAHRPRLARSIISRTDFGQGSYTPSAYCP